MWKIYLSKLAAVELADAVQELRESPLTGAQKLKRLNDLANKMNDWMEKRDGELLVREYQSGEGGLRYWWGDLVKSGFVQNYEEVAPGSEQSARRLVEGI